MVAAELWLCLCQNVEMLALELLTVLLESTLLPLLRGVPAYLTPEDYVAIAAALPGWLIPALFFGLLAAEFLGGAMVNRFGAKSLWLVWALCIGFQWELQAVQWAVGPLGYGSGVGQPFAAGRGCFCRGPQPAAPQHGPDLNQTL